MPHLSAAEVDAPAAKVERFVRETIIPYHRDPRCGADGPSAELVWEMRVADRCVQIMGGQGVSGDTIVEQVFREIGAFRIYDGPTEVHKWSLAKKIKRDHSHAAQGSMA